MEEKIKSSTTCNWCFFKNYCSVKITSRAETLKCYGWQMLQFALANARMPFITWPLCIINPCCTTSVPFHNIPIQQETKQVFPLQFSEKESCSYSSCNTELQELNSSSNTQPQSRRHIQDTALLSGCWHLRLVSQDACERNKIIKKSSALLVTALKTNKWNNLIWLEFMEFEKSYNCNRWGPYRFKKQNNKTSSINATFLFNALCK